MDTKRWIPHRSIATYIKQIHPAATEVKTEEFDASDPQYTKYGLSTTFKLSKDMNAILDTITYVYANGLPWYESSLTLESIQSRLRDGVASPLMRSTVQLPIHVTGQYAASVLAEWVEKGGEPDAESELAHQIRIVILEWSMLLGIVVNIPTGNIDVRVDYELSKKKTYKLTLTYISPSWIPLTNPKETPFSFTRYDPNIIAFDELHKAIPGDDTQRKEFFTKIRMFIAKKLGINPPEIECCLHDIEHRVDNILLQIM